MNLSALLTKKSTFVSTVVSAYMEFCLQNIEEQDVKDYIRGKFPKLKYTQNGYDVAGLSSGDSMKLLDVLYKMNIEAFGRDKATIDLEGLILQQKDRLGVIKDYEEAITMFPTGILDKEKIKKMSHEELLDFTKELLEKNTKIEKGFTSSLTDDTLKLSAERDILKATLYNASDGVFALNREGKIVTFNKVMEDLTGYSAEEALGKPASESIRLFDESSPLELGTYCPIMDTEEDKNVYTNNKVTLVTRSGDKKYVRIVSAVISEGKEVDIGCIVTLTDVTKEIQLETMKLDFVSIAAHELRTPITSIRGYLALIRDNVSDKIDESNKKYLDKVILSTDQLHILVENLLNISRIERGSLVLEKSETNWTATVSEVVTRFQETAKNNGVTLAFIDENKELPKVFVDKTMISEVLSNLLDNALKYTEQGGRVSVLVEQNENEIITNIKDTGIGIPQESLPHIFKKFYRVSTVLKQGKKGTGLGLFISREIVRLHGGRIWVKSDVGEGSIFSFSVPIAK